MKSRIAGVVVFNRVMNKVLLLKRTDGRWDLPKGHVEPGEGFLEGALRECWEETALVPGRTLFVAENLFINAPGRKVLRFYLGETTSFSVRMRPDEHVAYRWCDMDQVIALLGRGSDFAEIVYSMAILRRTFSRRLRH